MITELHIDGFRGLNNLDVVPLGRINILVGPSGSGKTNLLEAAFLFCGTGDPRLLQALLSLRQIGEKITAGDLKAHVEWFWTVGREEPIFIRGLWKGADRIVAIERIKSGDVIPLKKHADDSIVGEVEQDLEESFAAYEVRTDTGGATYRGYLYLKSLEAKMKAAKGPNLPCRFISVRETGQSGRLASSWSKVKDIGDAATVIEMLRSLDCGIKGVDLRADEAQHASVCIEHKRLGFVPLEYLGGGFGKAFAVACNIAESQNGVLIVDEFDSSLHVGAQPGLIRFTMESAIRHNIQLIVSTHSLETLDAFLDGFSNVKDLWSGPADLRVLQLKRENGSTHIRNLDAEKAKRLRNEIGFDLRRPG